MNKISLVQNQCTSHHGLHLPIMQEAASELLSSPGGSRPHRAHEQCPFAQAQKQQEAAFLPEIEEDEMEQGPGGAAGQPDQVTMSAAAPAEGVTEEGKPTTETSNASAAGTVAADGDAAAAAPAALIQKVGTQLLDFMWCITTCQDEAAHLTLPIRQYKYTGPDLCTEVSMTLLIENCL